MAETAPAGSVILCMLPDTGERYLSTPLFETIAAEMGEEELALSRSTPGFQLAAEWRAISGGSHAAALFDR